MAQTSMPEHILHVGNAWLESWGPSETLQTVGKAIPKRSGLDKVTGRARYAFDVQLPGMLYGAIVRSMEAAAAWSPSIPTGPRRYQGCGRF